MKVLLFADFRSDHARGWADGLESGGIEVHRLSSHQGSADELSGSTRHRMSMDAARVSLTLADQARVLEAAVRANRRRRELRAVVQDARPDVVHALRLTFEGVTALGAISRGWPPVVVSTWGQDIVRQAANSGFLRAWIRRSLPRASGLMADVGIDVGRAVRHGLRPGVPTMVAAGNFGVDETLFSPGPTRVPQVVFPRGVRVHMDVQAEIDLVREVARRLPGVARFIFVDAAGDRRIAALAERDDVTVLGRVARPRLAELLSESAVSVSTATSDGMPNSVLESLSAGAQTVAVELPQFTELAQLNPHFHVVPRDDTGPSLSDVVVRILEEKPTAPPVRLPEEYRIAHNRVAVPEFYPRVIETARLES